MKIKDKPLTRAEKKEESIITYQAEKLLQNPEWIASKPPVPEDKFHDEYFPEALLFVSTDPEHTMARKISKLAVVQVTRKGRVYDKLMSSFTPEERAIWDRDMDYDGEMTGFKRARAGGAQDALEVINKSPVKEKNKEKARKKVKKLLSDEIEEKELEE